MTTKDEALQMALDALGRVAGDDLQRWKKVADPGSIAWHVLRAIATCRAALAQTDEQEPIGEAHAYDSATRYTHCIWDAYVVPVGTKLYTALPECQPLTDEQIKGLIEEGVFFGNCKEIVRAIEAAHGIKKGGQHGTE